MSFSLTFPGLPEGSIGVRFKHALEQLVHAHAADLEVQRQQLQPVSSRGPLAHLLERGPLAPKGEPTIPPTCSMTPRGPRDDGGAILTSRTADSESSQATDVGDLSRQNSPEDKLIGEYSKEPIARQRARSNSQVSALTIHSQVSALEQTNQFCAKDETNRSNIRFVPTSGQELVGMQSKINRYIHTPHNDGATAPRAWKRASVASVVSDTGSIVQSDAKLKADAKLRRTSVCMHTWLARSQSLDSRQPLQERQISGSLSESSNSDRAGEGEKRMRDSASSWPRRGSTLFSDSQDASQDDPEERLRRLQKLFDRLSPDEEFIDAERCHEIMVVVLGHKRAPDLAVTQQTLSELCRHVREVSRDPANDSMNANIGDSMMVSTFNMYVIDFTTFAYLMEWERLGLESPSTKIESTVTLRYMRDSLIKYGADVLIAKYARLHLPTGRSVEKNKVLRKLEPISGIVILLNSLSIGLSEEFDWSGWDITELFFTVFLIAEITIKISLQGCRGFVFQPNEWTWNWFDTALVFLAISDVILQKVADDSGVSLPAFSIVRLARIARLTRLMRLLRLLRLKIFKELLLMVKGVIAGLRTLFWAIVLLMVLVYACAVMLMQTVGNDDVDVGEGDSSILLFPSLMWSMFNIFRCFMSDGTLIDGTPLVGHLEAKYGVLFVLPYTLVTLFIFFGIFNLIAAIFVEKVIESAKTKRELAEESDRMRVAQILRALLLKFTSHERTELEAKRSRSTNVISLASGFSRRVSGQSSHNLEEFFSDTEGHNLFEADGQITRAMFTRAIKDPKTMELLDDLEIQIGDRSELFDVLDADNSGEIEIAEMISGLMKMRSGGADRSDIVATILGLRSVQNFMREFKVEFQLVYENLDKQHANYQEMMQYLEEIDRKLQDRGSD